MCVYIYNVSIYVYVYKYIYIYVCIYIYIELELFNTSPKTPSKLNKHSGTKGQRHQVQPCLV